MATSDLIPNQVQPHLVSYLVSIVSKRTDLRQSKLYISVKKTANLCIDFFYFLAGFLVNESHHMIYLSTSRTIIHKD